MMCKYKHPGQIDHGLQHITKKYNVFAKIQKRSGMFGNSEERQRLVVPSQLEKIFYVFKKFGCFFNNSVFSLKYGCFFKNIVVSSKYCCFLKIWLFPKKFGCFLKIRLFLQNMGVSFKKLRWFSKICFFKICFSKLFCLRQFFLLISPSKNLSSAKISEFFEFNCFLKNSIAS